MKYVHPDVLDNGLAHLRINATRALLLPAYTTGMTYAQALSSSLAGGAVSPVDFTLSNDGTGRKIVFAGATAVATKTLAGGAPLHIALTDGVGRLLLVDTETSQAPITTGRTYTIPAITYAISQPE